MSGTHQSEPWGCGCWTVCSCGWHPEMHDEMTPVLGRQAVDQHVAEAIAAAAVSGEAEKRMPDNGEPVDMSQVTLGPRYSSEDMYRDMGVERPVVDVPWSDTVHDVTITIGESEKP